MNGIISSPLGLIHLVSAFVAMVFGLWVLVIPKGDLKHKQIGYIYLAGMAVLNTTAFMIYSLYGYFGIFHWMAVLSSLTLIAGMVPILTKRTSNPVGTHLTYMYWSVVGLYAAFMAEVFSRLPKIVLDAQGKPTYTFYNFIGIAIGLVMGIGIYVFIKFRKSWEEEGKNV